MNRRRFIAGGGAIIIGSGGAAGWRAHDVGLLGAAQTPFAPWLAFESASQGDPSGLAIAATLASNPHNTQPWKLAANARALTIVADTERHLGAFDPFRREMWIGLGAAIGNAEVAAPGLGFRTGPPQLSDLGANGEGRVTLSIETASPKKGGLADAISRRRTNRGPYQEGPLSPKTVARVLELTGAVEGARLDLFERGSAKGVAFARGTLDATRAIVGDAEMSHDGHVWYRANPREVERHRDGVSVPTAGLPPMTTALAQMLPEPDAATAGRYWLASTETHVTKAAGFGLITVEDLDSREGQIACGRLWQRMHLALTTAGLAAHPINQLPEMVDRDRQLNRSRGWREKLAAVGGDDRHVTFAFRFGVAQREAPHSARRPLNWVAT